MSYEVLSGGLLNDWSITAGKELPACRVIIYSRSEIRGSYYRFLSGVFLVRYGSELDSQIHITPELQSNQNQASRSGTRATGLNTQVPKIKEEERRAG